MMHTMSEHAGGAAGLGVSVLPFDGMGLYEQRRPRLIFKVPRVVLDQKGKFETDELFRRLSRESEASLTYVRYSIGTLSPRSRSVIQWKDRGRLKVLALPSFSDRSTV